MARVGDIGAAWLQGGLDEAFAQVAGRFRRREVRVRARACLAGMLSGLERKTGWSLAERAGEASPDGMQRLFTTACWDEGLVRDDLRSYVAAGLGAPDGVLIGDDTGFEKKGTGSAGVQRQYTGTAGKITNCQVGVFLAYASRAGRALIDRELYLPRSWTADRGRCAAAKVPAETGFATKPQLLQAMIERVLSAGPTATTGHCARSWRSTRSATSWPSPAIIWSARPSATAARMRWPGRCRPAPGSGSAAALAPKASAGMTGRWSRRSAPRICC
jgi:DDE superfamily endonuclease